MSGSWNSFWLGTGAAILIAIAAAFALQSYSISSGDAYSTSNTRL